LEQENVTAGPNPTERKKKCPACGKQYQGNIVVCATDGTLLIPDKQGEMIGSTIGGNIQILEEIGHGGMSIVFKGQHMMMDRLVAIKMLQSQLLNDLVSIERFKREAQAVACLRHPNVISVYDCSVNDSGQPYIVMDYIVGESLSDIIKRNNHVEPKRAVRIFLQACDALEHAHQKGVIHRDLKSSNIMLVSNAEGKVDDVRVVDFGIAKLLPSSGKQSQNLTQTGEIFGSPIYMSPEQCMGQPLDPRSDIYSMGAMMYEALTGQPPLMGDTIVDTMQMHVATKPPSFEEMRPDLYIPPVLERLVFRALEKKPEHRFQSMQELVDALQSAANLIEHDTTPQPMPRETTQKTNNPRSTRQNLTGSRAPGTLPKPKVEGPRTSNSGMRKSDTGAGQQLGAYKFSDLRKQQNESPGGGNKKVIIIGVSVVIAVVCAGVAFWIGLHP
jgi:serine/threonine protein kinase